MAHNTTTAQLTIMNLGWMDGWKDCSQKHISLTTNRTFNDFAFIVQLNIKGA